MTLYRLKAPMLSQFVSPFAVLSTTTWTIAREPKPSRMRHSKERLMSALVPNCTGKQWWRQKKTTDTKRVPGVQHLVHGGRHHSGSQSQHGDWFRQPTGSTHTWA